MSKDSAGLLHPGMKDDRLLVGVLGNRNSGKSHTWNLLFGRRVRRGVEPRYLQVRPGEWVQVFLVSGSFEERKEYAGDVLKDQSCRIVLCSLQYTEEVGQTLEYLVENRFFLRVQWLNPGYRDSATEFDRLGLVDRILSVPSTFSIRSGKKGTRARVQELREFIYAWARYRDLIVVQ